MRRRTFVFVVFEAALIGAASLVPGAASAQMAGMRMAPAGDTATLLPATQALLEQVRAATAR